MLSRTSWWARRFVVALSLSIAAIAVVQVAAFADIPAGEGGTFALGFSPTAVRSADGNTFISFTFVENIQGALNGTRTGVGTLVVHPDGTVNARDSGVFVGTIDGASGTAILRVDASGTFSAVNANFTVSDGTDGLAGVHVEGTVAGSATGPTSFGGSYLANIHWSN